MTCVLKPANATADEIDVIRVSFAGDVGGDRNACGRASTTLMTTSIQLHHLHDDEQVGGTMSWKNQATSIERLGIRFKETEGTVWVNGEADSGGGWA